MTKRASWSGAFNRMIDDLRVQKQKVEESQRHLRSSNDELERRRRHMEIVLSSISSGVIAVDDLGQVVSVNRAAKALLDLHHDTPGTRLTDLLGEAMYSCLWLPVLEGLSIRETFQGQVDLGEAGLNLQLLIRAVKIREEDGLRPAWYVLVLDDAAEQAAAQKVAAWREVARRIAHEIKNPITPIKLNAQRLLRRFHDQFSGERSGGVCFLYRNDLGTGRFSPQPCQ